MSEQLFDTSEIPAQPRPKWFLKRGENTELSRGFSSKDAASEWINGLGRRLDWRAGFVFRLRGENVDMSIVDRNGVEARP